MIEVALNCIEKYFGANKILNNVTFEIQTGSRTGLIGRNGTGKTTLFKIISGEESYDGGVLSIRKGAVIGYLHQIPSFPENYSVTDVLNSAFEKMISIKERLKGMEIELSELSGEKLDRAVECYGSLLQQFEHMGGYELEERIDKVCSGLKIYDDFRLRSFDTLSGGEKTTVILAKVLLQEPDVLLLDEPTNHLDMESIEWLEGFLSQYNGTVLIISHDRYFLDKVVKRIIELEDGEAAVFNGNYSFYVEEKERRLLDQFEAYQDQQKKIKAIEKAIKDLKEWGDRGDNPKFHRKATSMQKRLDRMERIDKPILDAPKLRLGFSGSDRSGKDVVAAVNLSKSFNNRQILNNLNMYVRYGERAAIIGKNGCGKSTLLKILLNQYKPDCGEVIIGSSVKPGYLEQEISFDNEELTIIEAFRENFDFTEGEARRILAGFQFYKDDVFKKVKSLSGGEKSRLKLCRLMHQDINLLILDEPTNHLDIDSREALEEALTDFSGTVIFISHDRYFLNKLADRIMELSDCKLTDYAGNYDYYREKKTERELLKEAACKKEINTKPKKMKSEIYPAEKSKSFSDLEDRISSLEKLIAEKDFLMEKNSDNYVELSKLYMEKAAFQEELDSLMEEWINLV